MTWPDYPYQGRYLEISGLRLHYLDEGPRDGEVVLMLHGNPTWSFYYRKLVAALCDRYRCVVPDHIGMGLSDKPTDDEYDYTLERRVTDIEALLDDLQITSGLTLVLHDWGGMIGMAWAARHPQRVTRIVVFNTGAFHLPAGKRMPWQLTLCRMPIVGALLVRGLNAFCRGAVRSCVTRRTMTPAVRKAYLAPYDSWRRRIAVHRFVQDIPLRPGDRAYDVISEVETKLGAFQRLPMLICWGMRDFVFDVHFLDEWARRFPDAPIHRCEDAGHYVLEDAAEQVIPTVRQFLDEQASGGDARTDR